MIEIKSIFHIVLILISCYAFLKSAIHIYTIISLIKKGINPVYYYKLKRNGQNPRVIHVGTMNKTIIGQITTRWYGQDKFGMVITYDTDTQVSISVPKDTWLQYKTGDKIKIDMKIVKDIDTGKTLDDRCKYHITAWPPTYCENRNATEYF